jgi:tetratricopeptide (TPR) repeat protein
LFTAIALALCALFISGTVPAHGQSAASSTVDGREALQTAASLVRQGQLDEAERQARRALADPATQAAAYSVLGTIAFQRQRVDDSIQFLKKAIQLDGRLVGARLSLAEIYLNTGNRSAAGELAKDWIRLKDVPDDLAIKFGVLFATHGAGPEAVEILEHVRASGGPSYELAFNLAGAYLVANDPARALENYDAALALKPDSLPALRQAALVAEQRGELERSLSYWLRAKTIEPEDAETLLGFGRVCLRMDLLDDAEPALLKAASLKPDDRTYQYTLAAAKVGKRQFEAARHLVEPLVARQPGDPQLQYALGSILYLEGQLNDAATHLRESLRLQPEQLASQYYLGLVVRDQGNDAEAIAILEKLLARFPDHAASCEALGGLLMTAHRYDEAERQLRQAIRLNPKLVKANYQLGLLLARMGRKDEADRQLALAKTLREEDEASSRLQLRLLGPGQ